MGPTVVSNLMTFASRAFYDLGMLLDVFTDDKKGGVDAMLRQQIEETRSEFFTWAIVKRQGDVWSIHWHGADRDLWLWRCRGRLWFFRRRCRFLSEGDGNQEERGTDAKETKHGR